MSVFKAFFGLGKIPQVVKFFEFQSFDDVNKMGGAIRALKEQARMSGTQLTKAQERYLDDQMKQVEIVFEKIQQPSTQSGIRSTKSAKVFDMEGKEIDPRSQIMGGKQAETEAEILERMNKSNKKNVGIIKRRKMKEEISKVNDQIEEMIESGVNENNPELAKLYDKQNDLELKLDFEDMISPDPEDFAQGGRAGFKLGTGEKFLKFLKKFKVKQSGDDVKDFLSKRQFMKNIVGNTKKNEQARELAMLKEAMKDAKGFKFPSGKELRTDIEKTVGPILLKDRKLNSDGGRAGFRTGLGKRFLELVQGKVDDFVETQANKKVFRSKDNIPKSFFSEKKGPITTEDMASITGDELRKIRRTQELGLYDETPEILKAGNLLERFTKKVGDERVIDYGRAEIILNRKLRGDETLNELLQIEYQTRPGRAEGGRIGYKDGKSLLDFIDVKASGSKSGKQQIQGAPKGFTTDAEQYNFIASLNIPVTEKINLLANIVKGKSRDRIEKDSNELFLMDDGYKNRNIGLSFNEGGEGLRGSVLRNLETGDDNVKVELVKRFAEGGRIGLKDGMNRRTFLKIMGGLASVPILGKFLKPAKVASKVVQASPVVNKSTPPAYFFELANKIKTLGRVSDGPAERIKIHSMPAKDGKSELMLTEDIGTGEMQIKKIGKEEDMTTKVETMEYTPGSSQADETTQGIPADSYDEYTEFNSRIIKDEYNEPVVEDGIDVKEIVEEVEDQAPSIKKAGGGIARMLGE